MVRWFAVLGLCLVGCDGDEHVVPPIDAAVDAAVVDGPVGCDGACAGEGGACGNSPADLDANPLPCAPGLVCCYPCGIPDCVDRCITPCDPAGGGCQQR